jgi:CheY-like chemotaxis protein
MREIAEWLLSIEHEAGGVYKEAYSFFKDDDKLRSFLKHLSDDEALHFHIMGSAAEHFSKEERPSPITVDDETRKKIEAPLLEIGKMLSEKSLTKEDMFKYIVAIEYSEFNDIFLYVIDILKESTYEFSYGASKIQHHLNYIENFMRSMPEAKKHLDEINKLPPIWEKRILLVDDMLPVIHLLKAVLEKEGSIETANNGKEAVEKSSKQYFDLIVTDIQMPFMNGIDFFRKLSEKDPKIRKNFVFFTGKPTRKDEEFIKKNDLRLLRKPSSIKEIRQVAHEILSRTP